MLCSLGFSRRILTIMKSISSTRKEARRVLQLFCRRILAKKQAHKDILVYLKWLDKLSMRAVCVKRIVDHGILERLFRIFKLKFCIEIQIFKDYKRRSGKDIDYTMHSGQLEADYCLPSRTKRPLIPLPTQDPSRSNPNQPAINWSLPLEFQNLEFLGQEDEKNIELKNSKLTVGRPVNSRIRIKKVGGRSLLHSASNSGEFKIGIKKISKNTSKNIKVQIQVKMQI